MTQIDAFNEWALRDGSTASLQATGDNTTKIATTSFVRQELTASIPSQTINVRKNANTAIGEFDSIASAVNSITDSSATKPYIIKVEAGIYTEPIIDLSAKTNISIIGSSIETTILQPDGLNHCISLGANCELSFVTVRNATSGKCGVIVNDIGQFAQMHKVSMFDNDTHIKVISNTQDTLLYIEYVDINGTYTNGLDIEANNSFKSEVNAENFYCFPTAVTNNILVDGSQASLTLLIGGIIGIGSDVGILVRNSSIAGIFGMYFNGCQIAIQCQDSSYVEVDSINLNSTLYNLYIPNVGVSAIIKAEGIHCSSSATYDIKIDSSTADGSIQGNIDLSKVSIHPSTNIPINFLDSVNHQSGTTGSFLLGDNANSLTDVKDLILSGAMGLLWGGEITINSGLIINIAAGAGYLEVQSFPNQLHRKISWATQTLTLSANSDLYVYWNTGGALVANVTHPTQTAMILLGRVVTNATGIVLIDEIATYSHHAANRNNEFLRDLFGSQFETGSLVSENATPFKLDVTSGIYYYADNEFEPTGGTQITFDTYYKDGSSGWTVSASQTLVTNQYDNNSGTLQNLASNEYTKHTLYLVGYGANEKYFLVYGQNAYTNLNDVENAGLPVSPSYFKEGVAHIASIIVKGTNATIHSIIDIRPRPLSSGSSSIAITNHGDLSGLNTPSHHPWALDINGSNTMLANLDMGTHNINSVGTINSVTVETHASRHKHGGADEISTVTPTGSSIPKSEAAGTLALGWIPTIPVTQGGTGATNKTAAAKNLSVHGYDGTYASGLAETTNTSNATTVTQITLTTPIITDTKFYRIDWAFNWRSGSTTNNIFVELLVDGVVTKILQQRPPATTATDLYAACGYLMSSFAPSTTHTIVLRYRSTTNGAATFMSNARLHFYGWN